MKLNTFESLLNLLTLLKLFCPKLHVTKFKVIVGYS